MKRHSGTLRRALTIGLGLVVAVVAANAAVEFTAAQTHNYLATLITASVSTLVAVLSMQSYIRRGRSDEDLIESHKASMPDAANLVRQIDELEMEAAGLIPPRADNARTTVFDIRAGLSDAGIWSEEDVASFDRAVRVRNTIVHSGPDEVGNKAVKAALRTVERLKWRIETFEKS